LDLRNRCQEGADGERADFRSATGGRASDPARLTILVAEDDSTVRTYIGSVLRTHGYRVLQAGDGIQALEVAAQHAGPIHLLLTDLTMPRLDGQELHRRLDRERPETRILFMSGLSDTGLDPGAAFLSKPFAAGALMRKVGEVLHSQVRQSQP
jgi:DNA-binding response OmpR family regulator